MVYLISPAIFPSTLARDHIFRMCQVNKFAETAAKERALSLVHACSPCRGSDLDVAATGQ